jgi:Spy/CpxP family protein refolding chaperone
MKRIIAIVATVVVAMASTNPAQAGPQRRGRIIIRPQIPPAPGQRGRYIDVDYPTPEKRAANLAELLSLTDDQKQKVQAIFADQDKQTLALWSDESLAADARMKKIAEVRDAAMKKARDLLTGEQKKKYDAIGADENEKQKQPGR